MNPHRRFMVQLEDVVRFGCYRCRRYRFDTLYQLSLGYMICNRCLMQDDPVISTGQDYEPDPVKRAAAVQNTLPFGHKQKARTRRE